jgi:hypothetical protein
MHRLQLLSGRLLKTYPVRGASSAIVDVAVLENGTVFALDAAGRRPAGMAAGWGGLRAVDEVGLDGLTSLAITAAGGAPQVAYVAHGGGISRIDLSARTVTTVSTPKGGASVERQDVPLAGIERLRFSRDVLIAVKLTGAGARELVRLDLDRRGRAIDRVTPVTASAPLGESPALTASGDALYYLGPSAAAELVVYRVTLR